MRFRCLLKHRVLQYVPDKCSKIINTCVILHNMCVDANVELIYDEVLPQDIDLGLDVQNINYNNLNEREINNAELRAGRRVQQHLIRIFQ